MGPSVQAKVQLTLGEDLIDVEIVVPPGPCRPLQLLPRVQDLAKQGLDGSERRAESLGGTISCQAGCGACCRQMVPIGENEAHHVAAVVERMPEPRRSVVRDRFASHLAALRAADIPLTREEIPADEMGLETGMRYFRLGLACPFLEEESCSIHPDRPLACREYLVTSPAEKCQHPETMEIEGVDVPRKSWVAFAMMGTASGDSVPWIPLITALEFADAHPVPEPSKTGPELVQEYFSRLTGAQVPGPNLR